MSKTPRFQPLDTSSVHTYPIGELSRKVGESEFARPFSPSSSVSEFIASLPDILAARNLRQLARTIAQAAKEKKPVILMFGGHLIKVGLSPLVIEWMRRGVVTSLATNGASIIHDVEIALWGRTSEDVGEGLAEGKFGMSEDTGSFINRAINDSNYSQLGMGELLATALHAANPTFKEKSLFWSSLEYGIPLTVHIAIGTDIIHQHPLADGANIGRATFTDFKVFCAQVAQLCEGAVVMNFGSAVIMPEVFLKALTIVRNLGYPAHRFTTANFDMYTHYRPTQNVLIRPTLTGGEYFNFIGHHEFMFPLLFAAVNSLLANG